MEKDKNAHEVNPTLEPFAANPVWRVLDATELRSQVQELYRIK